MARISSPSAKDVEKLKSAPVLSESFSGPEVDILAKYMICEFFPAGETIMKRGTPATSLMFLTSGTGRVVLDEQQVRTLGEGDLFGEAMFSEEAVRTADVIAKTDATAAELTPERYEALLSSHPEVALKAKRLFESLYRSHRASDASFFHEDATRYLALIAHNEMKSALVAFVKRNRDLIDRFPLVATGTTGQLLYNEAGVVLSRRVKSGPLGGDQAIGSMIASDNIAGILFFRDPLSAHPHHADIEALGRLCDVYQVPFATNPTTAVAVLRFLCEGVETGAIDNPALAKYQDAQAKVLKPRS